MAEAKKLPGLLYDKSTGWWFSELRDPSKKCGRTKITWAKDKREAKQLYKANIAKAVIEHAERQPEVVQVRDARSWSLAEMAAHYYDVKKADGCSALFLNAVRHHIQKFMDWLTEHGFDVAKKSAAELSSALLASYRQNLAEDKALALKTANHYISYVRMLLLWGAKMHGIQHPPIGALSQFSTRRNAKAGHGRKQDRTPFTWEELEKLLRAADITDSALLMLGLNCGFGNSDIGTLKLCDVDLENGTVSHPRPKTKVERDFTLWPETVDVLKQYLEKERGKPRNDEIAKLFFVTLKGCPFSWTVLDKKGKLQRSDAVGNRFDRLCERAGVTRRYGVGFYILRHTYATYIGEQSCDYRELQAALGQLTLQQQEAYRHDRKTKAYNAQQRLRGTMQNSSIPQILHDKISGVDAEADLVKVGA
jgi:integrase